MFNKISGTVVREHAEEVNQSEGSIPGQHGSLSQAYTHTHTHTLTVSLNQYSEEHTEESSKGLVPCETGQYIHLAGAAAWPLQSILSSNIFLLNIY